MPSTVSGGAGTQLLDASDKENIKTDAATESFEADSLARQGTSVTIKLPSIEVIVNPAVEY